MEYLFLSLPSIILLQVAFHGYDLITYQERYAQIIKERKGKRGGIGPLPSYCCQWPRMVVFGWIISRFFIKVLGSRPKGIFTKSERRNIARNLTCFTIPSACRWGKKVSHSCCGFAIFRWNSNSSVWQSTISRRRVFFFFYKLFLVFS